MSEALQERLTGAEDIVWDLSVFYQSLDDPQMEADIARLTELVDAFQARWRGKVAEMSAADFVSAYEAMEAIYDLRGRLGSFAFLNFSTDTGDTDYQAAVARIEELESALSQKMVFFDLEWNALADEQASAILDDPVCRAISLLPGSGTPLPPLTISARRKSRSSSKRASPAAAPGRASSPN